jgi:hypothetical protein
MAPTLKKPDSRWPARCFLLAFIAALGLLSQGGASLGRYNALPANLEDQFDFPLGMPNLS